MRVLILTLGTRGDVQPFVALGRELVRRGHGATVCTCDSFLELIVSHGVEHAPMDDGFMRLVDSAAGRRVIEDTRSPLRFAASALRILREVGPLRRRIFADAWAATQATRPDVIVAHPKTAWAIDFADLLGVPVVMTCFQPVLVPTAEVLSLGLPVLPSVSWINRISYRLVQRLVLLGEGSHVQRWRRESGLGPRRFRQGLLQRRDGSAVPVLHPFPEAVFPRPADWPSSAIQTGDWALDEPESPLDRDLEAFLREGPAPVYVGFGSMAGSDPMRVGREVEAAIAEAGIRAIVARGRGGIEGVVPRVGLHVIDGAPHGRLLPRVAAVVHHGGAGTTFAGLRAGRPTLVCPFFGDQPFWGRRVAALGVGPDPIPQGRLARDELAVALRRLVGESSFRARAEALGARLREGRGTEEAAVFLEREADRRSSLAVSH